MEDRLTTRSACPQADQQLARPTWWKAHSEVWVGYDPTVAVRVESSRRHWTSTRGSHGNHRTGPTAVRPRRVLRTLDRLESRPDADRRERHNSDGGPRRGASGGRDATLLDQGSRGPRSIRRRTAMRFPYQHYEIPISPVDGSTDLYRPEIPLHLIGESDELFLFGLLDTGADGVVIGRGIAETIGATLDENVRCTLR